MYEVAFISLRDSTFRYDLQKSTSKKVERYGRSMGNQNLPYDWSIQATNSYQPMTSVVFDRLFSRMNEWHE